MAAWDGGRVARGLIGQFDFGFDALLTTNTLDWEVYLTPSNKDTIKTDGSAAPSTDEIEGQIAYADANTQWASITNSIAYGGGVGIHYWY